MARMFGPLQREAAFPAPASADRWRGVLGPLASTSAGLALGAALVAVAALRMAPEPIVTRAVDQPAVAIPVLATPVAQPVVTPAPAATVPAATAAPAPIVAPPPAPPPPRAAAYRYGGRSYATVVVATGSELSSPLAGRAEVTLYQLIDGQIRTGANVQGVPYFPYIVVRSAERTFTLRPGALGSDSEVLVTHGQQVSEGTPLVRVVGGGPSSWATFYDRSVHAQVVASLTTAAGTDLDAVALFP